MDIILPQPLNVSAVAFTRASIASTRNIGGNHTIVGSNQLRLDYYKGDDLRPVCNGVLVEPRRTNYLTGTASSLVPNGTAFPLNITTQTVSFVGMSIGQKPTNLTLSFFGNANSKVRVIGGGFTYELQGSSDISKPVYITFPVRSDTLLVEVTGVVYAANLEGLVGFSSIDDPVVLTKMTRPTSWIPTTTAPATREADVVDQSSFVLSSFTEPSPPWSSTTTYSTGDTVDRDFFRWSSTSDSNTGNVPSASSTFWTKVQSVNTVALIDRTENSSSSQQQGDSGAYFCYVTKIDSPADFLKPVPNSVNTFFDSAALFEVNAKFSELVVSVSTNAGVFTKVVQGTDYSGSLANTGVMADVYEFLQNYISMQVYNCTVTMRLHNETDIFGQTLNPTQVVSANELVFGIAENLGRTAYGMRTGIIDYSKKETNEFGITSYVKRGFSKRLNCSVYIENADYNRVMETLQKVRAQPTAWLGNDMDVYSNGALVFGAFKDFTITINYPTYSLLDIEIEGLVI